MIPEYLAQFDDSYVEERNHNNKPYQTPNGVKITFHNMHAIFSNSHIVGFTRTYIGALILQLI